MVGLLVFVLPLFIVGLFMVYVGWFAGWFWAACFGVWRCCLVLFIVDYCLFSLFSAGLVSWLPVFGGWWVCVGCFLHELRVGGFGWFVGFIWFGLCAIDLRGCCFGIC